MEKELDSVGECPSNETELSQLPQEVLLAKCSQLSDNRSGKRRTDSPRCSRRLKFEKENEKDQDPTKRTKIGEDKVPGEIKDDQMKSETKKNEAKPGENSVRRTRARALHETEMPGPSGLSKMKSSLPPSTEQKRGRGRPRKLENKAANTISPIRNEKPKIKKIMIMDAPSQIRRKSARVIKKTEKIKEEPKPETESSSEESEEEEEEKLVGAAKRKARRRPCFEYNYENLQARLNSESQLNQVMRRFGCLPSTPEELLADVSTHLRQLYNSEPLVLKTEHTELVNINDADFKKKMRIRVIPKEKPTLFLSKEEISIKEKLKRQLAEKRIDERNPESEKGKEIETAKKKLFSYLGKNFNHNGTRKTYTDPDKE
ncbi:Oidioi.mRNA.OKI2018_I69.XSR.g16718.t1.cds [Oikopleura dioica]|uniref:Oidioi.mRNA.OKI2018_I69.XSR.g16718.t1.cds n=1 Tax=Oikopleura dioica TaxID=34765 RepID=A0ABN7SH17_OIKDI|nr:Oidioi.mRNA.OKI2018_I69.XSR.g16718.t1.cds [Oikopleura dioica]